MWRLVSVPCVLTLLAAFPASGSAQAGEETETSEPSLQERVSEPAPEEPALELKLDDAGVGVTPSPPRTPEGYTLDEAELRVKRAKIGLGVSGGLYALGVAFSVGGSVCDSRNPPPEDAWFQFIEGRCLGFLVAGSVIGIGGVIGMIVSGVRLAKHKRDRDILRYTLRQAHYGTPPRVQWDPAQSRLVF